MRLPLLAAGLVATSVACAATSSDVASSLQQLHQAMLGIEYLYVDSVDTDHLAESAIRAMLSELDPHSTYLTADEVKAQNESLGGNFDGIGVRYQMESDTLLIVGTVKGGPSERLGIMAGDRIVAVDDTTVAGVKMSNSEIQRRLRGPRGTHVKVSILRYGETQDYDIVRDKIPVYSIESAYMASPQVGYIKIDRFAQTTSQEFADAMNDLTSRGMKHVVIDLQNNGGGIMQAAIEIANILLLPPQLIVYTKGRAEQRVDYTARGGRKFAGRIVVLVNEESASASEILSGALQDHDRAVVVGRRTFGKGLVQRPLDLPGGAMIRLTTSHYYTPSGRCIQKPYTKGQRSDYDKEMSERFRHGEHLSADSIHLPDSLRFTTDAGRTVYGGGGIMPDVFVPLDTSRISRTHRAIIARGTFAHFVLQHFDQHGREIKALYPDIATYERDFTVGDDIVDRLLAMAHADSIAVDTAELQTSIDWLRLQLKASLASDLYDIGDNTRIMNSRNPVYQQGLAIINDPSRYFKILTTR